MLLQTTAKILALQEDLPADSTGQLGDTVNSLEEELSMIPKENTSKRQQETQPFFRYKRDGLYGLL